MPVEKSEAQIDARGVPFPDSHGQAAMLLVEALLHGLLEKGLLTVDDALAITEAAAEVKEEVIAEHTEPARTGRYSLQLIQRIGESLLVDRTDGGSA